MQTEVALTSSQGPLRSLSFLQKLASSPVSAAGPGRLAGDLLPGFCLFPFMWFLMSKRENADPRGSLIKKAPLLDPIPVNRSSIRFPRAARRGGESVCHHERQSRLEPVGRAVNLGSRGAFPSSDIRIRNYPALHVVSGVQRASVCLAFLFQVSHFAFPKPTDGEVSFHHTDRQPLLAPEAFPLPSFASLPHPFLLRLVPRCPW